MANAGHKNIIGHQFKKGQSGNPGGRPKKLPKLDVILADVLGKKNKQGRTEAEAIMDKLIQRAKRGDVRAAEVLLERAYGKVKQDMNLTHSTIKILNIDPLADDSADHGNPQDSPT